MRIQVTNGRAPALNTVYFVPKGGAVLPGVPKEEFDGARLSMVLMREGKHRMLYVGLGDALSLSSDVWRQAAGTAVKSLLKIGATEIAFGLERETAPIQQIVEGALLAAYVFEDFKLPEARRKNSLQKLVLQVSDKVAAAAKKEAATGQILADATNLVRSLGNLPGNVVTPATLASKAQEVARKRKLNCRVWDEKKLKAEGFEGILSVGKGSAVPPRLIALEYNGASKKLAPIVLVGKAITFDSGGISIKPADRMDEMKFDKMGGCAVLGAMAAIADLKLPLNVVGLIGSAENMPSATSYRPGDLIKTYDGKTIEVLNTDAEGRIVLADVLAYGRKQYRPQFMIDFATLTGACVIALGGRRAGLFCRDAKWSALLQEAGDLTGDWLWPMPMGDEFEEQIKSEIAVAKNTGGREGGACTAASFLKLWAEDVPWAHVDIAGPAWTMKGYPYLEKGATGFGTRMIVEALRRFCGE